MRGGAPSAVSIPLLSGVFRAVFQVRGWDLRPGPVALQVGLVQVLPLSAGLLLERWKPELGARWAAPVQRIAMAITLTVVTNPLAIPAMAVMTATALVTSMRNPGLALLFAVSHGGAIPGLKLAIITYLLVTITASIPFLRWANQPSRG